MPKLLVIIFIGLVWVAFPEAHSLSETARLTFSKQLPATSSIMSVIPVHDAGFLIIGSAIASPSGGPIAVRMDSNGKVLWRKLYAIPGSYDPDFTAGIETNGGDFVLVGRRIQIDVLDNDPIVLRINSQGDLVWSKVLEDEFSDFFYTVTESKDGALYVGGETISFAESSSSDALLLKLTSSGNALWTKVFGKTGSGGDQIQVIAASSDGLLVGGSTDYSSGTFSKALAMKVDPRGQLQWQKVYFKNTGYILINYGNQSPDGGMILAGLYQNPFPGGNNHGILLKIRSNGSLAWKRTVVGNLDDQLFGVTGTADGGFLSVGQTFSKNFTVSNGLLIKLNGQGQKIWIRRVALDSLDFVTTTTDGSFVARGMLEGLFPVLLKLDSRGLVDECTKFGGAPVKLLTPQLTVSNVSMDSKSVSVNLKNANFRALPLSLPVKPICTSMSAKAPN